MAGWTPPANPRTVPPAPRMLTAPEDIEKLAAQLSKAKRPVVLTEGAGQEVETYEALVALCDMFALPLVEKPGALFANFPKDHPLYQGTEIKPFWNDMDLAIVVRARAPWYPPSNRPPKAVVAMVDEAPHNSAMVYQSHQADMYLEGNVAQTLRDLANAATVDKAAVEARRKELAAAHDALGREKECGAGGGAQEDTDRSGVAVRIAQRGDARRHDLYRRGHHTHGPLAPTSRVEQAAKPVHPPGRSRTGSGSFAGYQARQSRSGRL